MYGPEGTVAAQLGSFAGLGDMLEAERAKREQCDLVLAHQDAAEERHAGLGGVFEPGADLAYVVCRHARPVALDQETLHVLDVRASSATSARPAALIEGFP